MPRGIRPETLRAWGRALRGPLERSGRRPAARRVEVIEVAPAPSPVLGEIEISLAGKRQLVVRGDWSPSQVAELVVALEAKGQR